MNGLERLTDELIFDLNHLPRAGSDRHMADHNDLGSRKAALNLLVRQPRYEGLRLPFLPLPFAAVLLLAPPLAPPDFLVPEEAREPLASPPPRLYS